MEIKISLSLQVLWLLSYDDENGSLSEAVDRYCVGVPAIQWLPWIPQLLTCLVRPEGKVSVVAFYNVYLFFFTTSKSYMNEFKHSSFVLHTV